MMGDESGESMEPMVDGEKLGVDSRDLLLLIIELLFEFARLIL